ncbi:MAG: hypothetical protein JWL89_144 [Candidatus Saccharibacteria bacterium]|nr:hypothetical protein [Candidatus Saccharibacteria bacterium]
MKLVQLNIWGSKLMYQILDFVEEQSPDILCMQEVQAMPGASGNLFATLDEIKQAGQFEEELMSPTQSFNYMRRTVDYGNAILSRYPITASSTTFTSGLCKQDFDLTTDDTNVRNLQHVSPQINGQSVHVLNHHGYYVAESKRGNDETKRQMSIIADYIKTLDGPVILTGDFNLSPDSASIGILNQVLTNLSVEHKLENTYGQLSHHNTVCDYIFVNDLVNVTNFSVSDELVSDHKALILDFEV